VTPDSRWKEHVFVDTKTSVHRYMTLTRDGRLACAALVFALRAPELWRDPVQAEMRP
jgi:hypothetical protein